MYWYGDHMSGWADGFMTLSMVLFWGLVVAGVVLLVRYLGRDQGSPSEPAGPAAARLLAERFARGDIDEQECRRQIELLRATRPR